MIEVEENDSIPKTSFFSYLQQNNKDEERTDDDDDGEGGDDGDALTCRR